MALLEQWRSTAYSETLNKGELQRLWTKYFELENFIYAKLLADTQTDGNGTVIVFPALYVVTIMTMTGFLDCINDILKEENPIETLEEDTVVSLAFDTEKLYKNMVAASADWLYELPEWNDIYDEDTRKALYKEQKLSTTVVNEAKVYPNDPCPCGSGKKYKKCCGRN